MKLSITRKSRYGVAGGTQHDAVGEAFQDATNLALATPGVPVVITVPSYEVLATVDAKPPIDVPPPDPEPGEHTDPVNPADPNPVPPAGKPRIVSQELIPSKYVVKVGETFTVAGTLMLDNETSKPVTAYSLGFDKKLVRQPLNVWVPIFTAIAPGECAIKNINQKTTGRTIVTVLPNDDGEVFDPPPTKAPKPPVTPTDPGTPSAPSEPAPVPTGRTPTSPRADLPHTVLIEHTDSSTGVDWSVQTTVGEDCTAPMQYLAVRNAGGDDHPGLLAFFNADCCDIGAVDGRDGFDYAGTLTVTYDGEVVFHQDLVNFFNNTLNQTIRYGKFQPVWKPVDATLFPNFAKPIGDVPLIDLSGYDFSYNGNGFANVRDMGGPGMRSEIAFAPAVDVPFIVQPNDRTYAPMRKAADNTGFCPIYAIDRLTGKPFDITEYPDATQMTRMQYSSASNPVMPYQNKKQWGKSGSPYTYNAAHAPGYNFAAAAATGSSRDRFHASVWANAPLMAQNPDYRRTSGSWKGNQVRNTAWTLRSFFEAAYVSDMPEYFAARLEDQCVQGERQSDHPMGFVGTYNNRGFADGSVGEAQWESNFLRLVIGVIAKKNPEWQILNDRLKVFLTKMFATKWWQFTTHYTTAIVDAKGNPYTTPAEVIEHTLASWGADAATLLADETTPEQINAIIVAHHSEGWKGKSGDFDANYPYSAQDYPAIEMAAIATMCGNGPEWALSQSVPTKPNYKTGWQWHVVPKAA